MPTPMTILLSTRNPGKVAELRRALSGLPVRLVTPGEIGPLPEVDEDRDTLEGNAEKKARVLHLHTGLPALADDTGLEVDALGGRPGVRSARYAGLEADDAANRALLLRELAGRSDRRARFRTVLAFVDASAAQEPGSGAAAGGVRFFEGACAGRILTEERGRGGFGYDRLFVPEGLERTFAELSAAEKNAVSHRGRAVAAFAAYLRERLPAGT